MAGRGGLLAPLDSAVRKSLLECSKVADPSGVTQQGLLQVFWLMGSLPEKQAGGQKGRMGEPVEGLAVVNSMRDTQDHGAVSRMKGENEDGWLWA